MFSPLPGVWVSQLLPHCGNSAGGDDGGGLCSHQGVLPTPLSAPQPWQQRSGPVMQQTWTGLMEWTLWRPKDCPLVTHTELEALKFDSSEIWHERCTNLMGETMLISSSLWQQSVLHIWWSIDGVIFDINRMKWADLIFIFYTGNLY